MNENGYGYKNLQMKTIKILLKTDNNIIYQIKIVKIDNQKMSEQVI